MWSLKEIEELISSGIEENLNLEYKAADALGKSDGKKAEISKDVSAFANSAGGILIYGIEEFNDGLKKHLPEKINPVDRKEFTKEWLEQVINSNISPKICGIIIHPITIGKIENNKVVYVVEIPQSKTAHQAKDKRYYRRFNFESVAMDDYEIKDILNRQQHPRIVLNFELESRFANLTVYANNIGSVFANYVNVKIRLPKAIVVDSKDYRVIANNQVEIFATNTVREIVDPFAQVVRYWPSRFEPILPQTRFKLTQIALQNHPFDYENIMEWDIFCDNANLVTDSIRLNDLLNQ